MEEVYHGFQPPVPTEENATYLCISQQFDDINTERNDDLICDQLEASHVYDPTLLLVWFNYKLFIHD